MAKDLEKLEVRLDPNSEHIPIPGHIPPSVPVPYGSGRTGVDLRDYFAAQAMAGLLSYVSHDDWQDGEFKATAARRYARASVTLADSLLAALKA